MLAVNRPDRRRYDLYGLVVMCETSTEVLKLETTSKYTHIFIRTYMYIVYLTYVSILYCYVYMYIYVDRYAIQILTFA